jgi:hypothetical protein
MGAARFNSEVEEPQNLLINLSLSGLRILNTQECSGYTHIFKNDFMFCIDT